VPRLSNLGHSLRSLYEQITVIMKNLILAVIEDKCPYCTKGKVFEKRKHFLASPKMNCNCPACGKDLIGEPGYFFGAMYVSYAIAVAIGIATFIVASYIFNITSLNSLIALVIGMIVIAGFKNFKISRILWLKLFPPGEGTNFYRK
jgi:uncharacterized protein (DUF983 family)